MSDPSPVRLAGVAPRTRFLLALLFIGLCPFLWRALLAARGPSTSSLQPSNLPAVEVARERYPFDPEPLKELRSVRPGIVVIGDSMTLRVDSERLTALTGTPVYPLRRLATGAAHWYLLLKNYVVASGVRPKWVVIFFRDTQLTDPLWRLLGRDRFSTDRYALDHEAELNRVIEAHIHNPWYVFHAGLDRIFALERARDWIEPALTRAVSDVARGDQDRDGFVGAMNGQFGLDRLRVMTAADMGDADEASLDFAGRVGISTLPLMLDLAKADGFHMVFVRVLRRPEDGRPPRESTGLRRYVTELRGYLAAQGAAFFDDREDPAYARMAYDDGDHILEPEVPAYTELFARRLANVTR